MNPLLVVILSAVIFLFPFKLSYADYDSFTVNVPNAQGGYTALVIKKSGDGYTGPQGEYYANFPSVYQLQNVYGVNAPPSTPQEEVFVSVDTAPPELPIYEQPEAPAYNYIWTPGYWSYDSYIRDYYWVPGTWVVPPADGLLWTPGYWYWRSGEYVFSDGYWGPHIGFYGGINYGHGYEGAGNSSFNGGPGGTNAQPTFAERSAMNEKHVSPTAVQTLHIQTAGKNTALRASVNHGKPAIAATVKPGVFKGQGVVAAKQAGAVYKNTRPMNSPAMAVKQSAQIKPKPKVIKPKPKNPPVVPPTTDAAPKTN